MLGLDMKQEFKLRHTYAICHNRSYSNTNYILQTPNLFWQKYGYNNLDAMWKCAVITLCGIDIGVKHAVKDLPR
jgi:hypothetical protein